MATELHGWSAVSARSSVAIPRHDGLLIPLFSFVSFVSFVSFRTHAVNFINAINIINIINAINIIHAPVNALMALMNEEILCFTQDDSW